ncbi:MAG: hypothetical protein ACHQUB_03100 [Candidatus Saccharimonadia bacterium]
MFQKIVSNLNFSPQVGSQLAYYAKRLRREGATRKLTMVAGTMALGLQMLVAINPPTSANASSPNDLIAGGFNGSKSVLIQTIDQSPELSALYHGYFHISDNDISNASGIQYIQAQGGPWDSVGRQRLTADSQLISVTSSMGVSSFYIRPLSEVATTPNASAIVGTNDLGQPFAILNSCGNIAVKAIPPPPPPPPSSPPNLTISKNVMPGTPPYGSTITPGSIIGYRISFSNLGQSTATGVYVEDAIPTNTTFYWMGTAAAPIYNHLTTVFPSHESAPTDHVYWRYQTLSAGATGYYADFQVKVNANTPNGTEICNIAYIRSDQTAQQSSGLPICFFVKTPVTPVPITPPPQTPPPIPVVVPPPVTPTFAHIQQFKTAIDLSQSTGGTPIDATTVTAQPGDRIEYSLKTTNSGNADQPNYLLVEDLTDVLEYANVTNPGGGKLITGSDGVSEIEWPMTTVKAGSTQTEVFQVTVKDPIPSTPQSTSNPKSYDLEMDNVYGNNVAIKVAAPPVKQVEQTTQALPQTGAGTSTLIMAAVFAMIVFFYFRNKELATEVRILRVDNSPGV